MKIKPFYFIAFILSIIAVVYFAKTLFIKESFADVKIVPTCPSGYKQFVDKPGNNVCCEGKINYLENTCNGSVCSLSDKIANPNKPGTLYEKCSDISYNIIKNKFNFLMIGSPGSKSYNIKEGSEVKDLETYKKLYCDKDKKCFGAGEINLTFNKTQKIKGFFSIPKIDITNLMSTPYDLKNGYVYDNITLHIKN